MKFLTNINSEEQILSKANPEGVKIYKFKATLAINIQGARANYLVSEAELTTTPKTMIIPKGAEVECTLVEKLNHKKYDTTLLALYTSETGGVYEIFFRTSLSAFMTATVFDLDCHIKL